MSTTGDWVRWALTRLGDRFYTTDLGRSLGERVLSSFTERPKAYWHRSRNFGDAMAPAIFEAASGVKTRWVPPSRSGKIVLQGSTLGWSLAENDVVWGSGLIREKAVEVPAGVRFIAVRGPLTRACLDADVSADYFDPGSLAPVLEPGPHLSRHPVGMIPHYRDLPHLDVGYNDVCVIDVRRPVSAVIRQIASCDAVLSSSLHGIIVAESFGLPACWLTMGNRVLGGNFKFRDYYLGTGREPMLPHPWNGDLRSALRAVREPKTYDSKLAIERLRKVVLLVE